MRNTDIEIISIEFPHLQKLLLLPNIHNDPFDGIIIAQAITEKLKLVTRDNKFKNYEADLIWG